MRTLSISDVSESLDVSDRTVETWIASGELRAVNVSRDRKSRKPRLRITQEALDSFLAGRTTASADGETKRSPRRRRVDVPRYI